jgi:hypothetical protein
VHREDLDTEERLRLTREDEMEAHEMSVSIAKQATLNVCHSVPGWQNRLHPEELQRGVNQKKKVSYLLISF